MAEQLNRGLDVILIRESTLSEIDGDAGELTYRGYDIGNLARKASYEQVLHLLWYGELPTETELAAFDESLAAERLLDEGILRLVDDFASRDAQPMTSLRTAVSELTTECQDETSDSTDREANLRRARRITAKLPTILSAFQRLRGGEAPVTPRSDLSYAANFLYMLIGDEPDDAVAETFDMALVLHADHRFNASTFSALVTASTLADLYAAITSAVGTLFGSLHGGANQEVMRTLLAIDEVGVDPVEWVENMLDEGRRVPGYGHRVYNVKDPRAVLRGDSAREISDIAGDRKWYDYSTQIEGYMTEKIGIAPNVDFYSASMYYQMGIPVDLYTPIFAMARAGGWIAHVLEQYEDNRLIRPRARYVGPTEQQFEPISKR